MKVIPQSPLEPTPFPGIHHATLAGWAQGLEHLSLWSQLIEPGSGTPPHRHDCEEVVLCAAGHGELLFGGQRLAFGPRSTVCIPANEPHQIVNTGDEPLRITAVFSKSPVEAFFPDGQRIDLPWST